MVRFHRGGASLSQPNKIPRFSKLTPSQSVHTLTARFHFFLCAPGIEYFHYFPPMYTPPASLDSPRKPPLFYSFFLPFPPQQGSWFSPFRRHHVFVRPPIPFLLNLLHPPPRNLGLFHVFPTQLPYLLMPQWGSSLKGGCTTLVRLPHFFTRIFCFFFPALPRGCIPPRQGSLFFFPSRIPPPPFFSPFLPQLERPFLFFLWIIRASTPEVWGSFGALLFSVFLVFCQQRSDPQPGIFWLNGIRAFRRLNTDFPRFIPPPQPFSLFSETRFLPPFFFTFLSPAA